MENGRSAPARRPDRRELSKLFSDLRYLPRQIAKSLSRHPRRTMTQTLAPSPTPSRLPDPQRLPAVLARYREPVVASSVAEIAVTLGPFVALWVAMWALMHVSYWLSLALAAPAAGFMVRLFMI